MIDEGTWSVEDVSAYLGVPVGTLYQWRYLGKGPRAAKVAAGCVTGRRTCGGGSASRPRRLPYGLRCCPAGGLSR